MNSTAAWYIYIKTFGQLFEISPFLNSNSLPEGIWKSMFVIGNFPLQEEESFLSLRNKIGGI